MFDLYFIALLLTSILIVIIYAICYIKISDKAIRRIYLVKENVYLISLLIIIFLFIISPNLDLVMTILLLSFVIFILTVVNIVLDIVLIFKVSFKSKYKTEFRVFCSILCITEIILYIGLALMYLNASWN